MDSKITKFLDGLIDSLANLDLVKAIGISGKLKPYPLPGKGDFDIFVYCDEIPDERLRHEQLSSSIGIKNIRNFGSSEAWGCTDFCTIENIETFVMFYKISDVLRNTKEILYGEHLWKKDNDYFPIGRVAMFSSINVFYDEDGFLNELKESLKLYPRGLKEKMISFHIRGMFKSEDFGRAVSRKDIIFYHYVLETAIEHFLMVMFAVNDTYFPSRKRSQEYIQNFTKKPKRCLERLLAIVKDSVEEEKIAASYEEFKELCIELREIC